MFDPINGLAELQDEDPNAISVRFTVFAQFLRESPLGLATFPNDDHLADVLSDALRLYPDSDWVCADNDNETTTHPPIFVSPVPPGHARTFSRDA